MQEPDCLDASAQRALIDHLAGIRIENMPQAVMQAAQICGGTEIIGRVMAGMRGPGRLTLHECLFYRVFDPKVTRAEVPRFLGQKMRSVQTLTLNSLEGREVTYDKVLWDAEMGRAGLPRPHLKAVYGGERVPAEARMLASRDEFAAFLGNPDNYPMVAKPNFGGRSLGLIRLEKLEPEGIRLHDGTVRPASDVIEFCEEFGTKGYLFQDVLAPHPAVAAITGGGLATLRVVILLDGQMPMIENLKMHIPGPNSLADTIWRGNSAGLLDPQTGQIKRVVRGSGLDLVELESHPATGADLLSFQLPDFDKLTDLMARISAEFPLLRLQGWDIAVTDRGYVPIELNFGGDVKLQQLCDGAGAMTPRYTELLKSAGYKGKLP